MLGAVGSWIVIPREKQGQFHWLAPVLLGQPEYQAVDD
jgi:hypothetical protein